jgi:hypothetical protein
MRTTEPMEIVARCLHDRTEGQMYHLARSFVGLGAAMTEGGWLHQVGDEDGPRWELTPAGPRGGRPGEGAGCSAAGGDVRPPILACAGQDRARGVAAAGGPDPGRLGGRGHRGGRLSTAPRAENLLHPNMARPLGA